ncbi:baseplate J/gp47 family protein [Candidatus Sumerlaeota bacterium]|nr:baseplate J/gp47 family protein [Candidatus Sumerlaeota bacterium]
MDLKLLRTYEEDVDLVIADIESRVPKFDAKRPGTMVNTIGGVVSMAKRDAQRFALREVMKTFFRSAKGDDLDILANDHLDLQRHKASGALGEIVLNRVQVTNFLSVPEGSMFVDLTGAQYLSQRRVDVVGQVARIPVRAVATGIETNRAANQKFLAADPTWMRGEPVDLFNQQPLAGGNPAETDDEFRRRCAAWWRSLRRATASAIRYQALSVSEVRRATLDESNARPHRGGYITLFVTDAQDGWNQLMLDLVKHSVDRDGRAAGIVVNVQPGTVIYQQVRVKLTLRPGASDSLLTRVAESIQATVNALQIGEPLQVSRLVAAAIATNDREIADAQITQPLTDIQPLGYQLLRTRPEDVTVG